MLITALYIIYCTKSIVTVVSSWTGVAWLPHLVHLGI